MASVILLLVSSQLEPVAQERLLPIAADAFKTILGAAIGALSTMMNAPTRT
jgi:hypothetical protein